MSLFKVIYTDKNHIDNQLGTLELDVPNIDILEHIITTEYPDIIIDQIIPIILSPLVI